jgi:hypothetical protein
MRYRQDVAWFGKPFSAPRLSDRRTPRQEKSDVCNGRLSKGRERTTLSIRRDEKFERPIDAFGLAQS